MPVAIQPAFDKNVITKIIHMGLVSTELVTGTLYTIYHGYWRPLSTRHYQNNIKIVDANGFITLLISIFYCSNLRSHFERQMIKEFSVVLV